MEEKLYFKPAKYGKGIKQKAKPEKDEDGGNNHRDRNLVILLLFLVIIILIILWLLRGKTTTSGQYPENLKTESLECTSDSIRYQKIAIHGKPKSTELKISSTFYGTEKLSSINLRYSMYFDSEAEAINAEAVAHASFNIELQGNNRSSSEFHNKFTILDNKLETSLFANLSDLDNFSKSYFVLFQDKDLPETLYEYRKQYEDQGFKCEASID